MLNPICAMFAILALSLGAASAAPADSASENLRPLTIVNADETIVSATVAGPEAKLPRVLGGFESYYNPKLARLRDEYNPGAALQGAKDEFDRIIRLRHWVASHLPVDNRTSIAYYDVFEILQEAKDPNNGFHCAHTRVVGDAVFSAYGFPTRMLDLDVDYVKRPQGRHHAVNEVWCSELGKWVVVDCKYDIHFERDGVPQSALELHEAVRRDGGKGIVIRWGPDRVDPSGDGKWHGRIDSYFWVGWWLRPTYLTQSHWYQNNDFTSMMVLLDTPGNRENRWPRHHDGDNIVWVKDRDEINWTPNIPKFFNVKLDEPGKLRIRLLSATPNYKEYRVRFDGGDWRTLEDPHGRLEAWPLHEGVNTLDVRARNLWDMDGPVVTLRVEYRKPAQE